MIFVSGGRKGKEEEEAEKSSGGSESEKCVFGSC